MYRERPDRINGMSVSFDPDPLFEETPRRRGNAFVAWLIIIPLVALPTVLRHFSPRERQAAAADAASAVALELQGRLLVGLTQVSGNRELTYQQLKASLDTGPVEQRLRFVVLAGELAGPKEAREQLREWKQRAATHGIELTDKQQALCDILDRLYADYERQDHAGPSLTPMERQALRQRLGWFGALALAPADGPHAGQREALLQGAHRAATAYFAIILAALVLGFLGLVALVMFLVFLGVGYLRRAIATGQTDGAIYAETFAVWMALFYALGFGAMFIRLPGQELLLSSIGALLSLAALAWPVLRGIPWRQVRRDIGWTNGRNPFLELFLGIPTYMAALPLLVVGVLLTFLLLMLERNITGAGGPDYFGPSDAPTHPLLNFAAGASWWEIAQIFLVAGVIAPFVEETMFRGVLYRHLREATERWGPALSILCSALVVSFLFAAIHPQGLATIPALMALAIAFSLAREWRGSLLPAMVAHGVNNAAVTVLLFLILRS